MKYTLIENVLHRIMDSEMVTSKAQRYGVGIKINTNQMAKDMHQNHLSKLEVFILRQLC